MTYIELNEFEYFLTPEYDTFGMKISIWTVVSILIVNFITQTILLIIRKEIQPLKARGTHILFLLLFGQVITILISNVRIAAGREKFPCYIYAYFQFVSVHCKFFQ
jgi:hypothetical protein